MDGRRVVHAVAVLIDRRDASPRPTSWRREIVLSLCFSAQMTKTFGLSQPSRSAECEKMKRTGSSNESSRSLFFRIRS